jgi:N-methylhydantoinase A/oxoprolinase/acetone carboxylase beta subunit
MMLLGVEVGGTFTDAVLASPTEESAAGSRLRIETASGCGPAGA